MVKIDIISMHRKVLRVTHGAEHYAAVAYSSCEVFELHHMIWFVSLGLVVFGIGAVWYERVEKNGKESVCAATSE